MGGVNPRHQAALAGVCVLLHIQTTVLLLQKNKRGAYTYYGTTGLYQFTKCDPTEREVS